MGLTAEEEALRSVTCCFTGHRSIGEEQQRCLRQRLGSLLEQLYRQGYRRFYSGGALGLDLLAAESVIDLRGRHADVQLLLALPCAEQTRRWPAVERERQGRLKAQADHCVTLSPHYYTGCMMVRNRHMVDRSSLCVCYLTHMRGGTLSTVRYALGEGLPCINLAMDETLTAGEAGQPLPDPAR